MNRAERSVLHDFVLYGLSLSESIGPGRSGCQPLERVRIAPLLLRVVAREWIVVVESVAKKGLTADVVFELRLGEVESAVQRA